MEKNDFTPKENASEEDKSTTAGISGLTNGGSIPSDLNTSLAVETTPGPGGTSASADRNSAVPDGSRSAAPNRRSGERKSRPQDPAREKVETANRPQDPAREKVETTNRPQDPMRDKGESANRPSDPARDKGESANRSQDLMRDKGESANRPQDPMRDKGETTNRPQDPAREKVETANHPQDPSRDKGESANRSQDPMRDKGESANRPSDPARDKGESANRPQDPARDKVETTNRPQDPMRDKGESTNRSQDPMRRDQRISGNRSQDSGRNRKTSGNHSQDPAGSKGANGERSRNSPRDMDAGKGMPKRSSGDRNNRSQGPKAGGGDSKFVSPIPGRTPPGRKGSWRDYTLQLSVVILGVVITFVGSGLIERWRQARQVQTTMHLIVRELTYNRSQLNYVCEKLRYDRQGMLMFDSYRTDIDRIPADSLERYALLLGAVRSPAFQTDALEVLKSSGVIQFVGDKELLMRILGCYRELDRFEENVALYNRRKLDAVDHFFAGGTAAGYNSGDVREMWRSMLEDPLCAAFIGSSASFFGDSGEGYFDRSAALVGGTIDALCDEYGIGQDDTLQ